MTRQPVEELRSSAGAARKNSRVRQWRSAQMLAFMRTPVPDEEPMSVDMFSPNTPRLFTPRGNGGSWVKGRTFHRSGFPERTEQEQRRGDTRWDILRLSHLWGQGCAGAAPQGQREGQQCFHSLSRMPFYGLCSASQHSGGWQLKLC